jgi:uncharacterized protein (DUF302 family)
MNEQDKKFWEHLRKQLEQDREEQGMTTLQILKKRQMAQNKNKKNHNK